MSTPINKICVLQLDTSFPRIKGDVASPESYSVPMERVIIKGATVLKIVREDPSQIDLAPFIKAIRQSDADLIITSCGFLAPFQQELQSHTSARFIASALIQLPNLAKVYTPNELVIVTFDKEKLNRSHLAKGYAHYEDSIIGLPSHFHLRAVIENDLTYMDVQRVRSELMELAKSIPSGVKAVLLECTNLPPYRDVFEGNGVRKVYDYFMW